MNNFNFSQDDCDKYKLICSKGREYSNTNHDNNEEEDDVNQVKLSINKNNIVSGEKLRKIQSKTLEETASYLSKTFGPMGSNTKIIKGTNQADVSSTYSKDGLKVLSNIINSAPIEASIVEELVDITKAVEKEVGDGTTSTVILSATIFKYLTAIEEKYSVPPHYLIDCFQEVVNKIEEDIKSRGRECTIEDIYNISMISTNGNEEVSKNIANIYEKYGMDVDLSVGISNTKDSLVKVYDGLTITEGFSDPVFINNRAENTAEIHDAHIYHFVDPIDSIEQITLFEAIMKHNIYEPIENNEAPIPTVITCPKLSRDLSATLKILANQLYQFDQQGAESAKPPILIITDVIASDEIIMDDIANLCGCKSIRKYIDPNKQKSDQEAGLAPTLDNVFDFCGHAELVVADSKKTKFINPDHMKVDTENGVEDDPIYTAMINFLESEIENIKDTESANEVGTYKKRLAALKANMVDYLVGGVTISERDAVKDLVEDAIKNCKSASLYGVGYAANFMGLTSAYNVAKEYDNIELDTRTGLCKDIAYSIVSSYDNIAKILYSTISSDETSIDNMIKKSLINGHPFNISNGRFDDSGDVLCSIMLDVQVLDTISRIISLMITSNQALLMATNLNVY